ncbi:MAG TPA: pyrimidine 5'-nucleotidase [Anaerolineae bacterium]|nr:pyrimidine 5'-nucleotidase [Anaerolineae bacterium]
MRRYRTLFLDLDDTLYPSGNGVWDAIGDRINQYMLERHGIPSEKIPELRDSYFRNYGTTLHGLMVHHGADPGDYLNFVHDIPLDEYLQPNPELKAMLSRLPQQLVIFTNASRDHVHRVLQCLDIAGHINAIVDIETMELHHKPQPRAYQIALEIAGEDNARACVLIDDRIENLLPGASLGMTTVHVKDMIIDGPADFHIPSITDLLSAIPQLVED